MLYEFLKEHKIKILEMTAEKSLAMSGVRPTAGQLRKGLPFFYLQLMEAIKMATRLEVGASHVDDPLVKKSAGELGIEMFKIGFTLSNVVHFMDA